jgi:uncharacterized protein
MVKKYFRKYLPDGDQVRAHRSLAWLGRWLHHPNLWHLNRDSVAGAVAIGLFAGLIPGPFQILGAALLAIPLRKNLPVAVITTLYTNPLTIVPIYVLAYGYGRLLLGASGSAPQIRVVDWDWGDWAGSARALIEWMAALGPPLALGLVALALTLAALGYLAVQFGWRAYVRLAWRRRAQRRAAAARKVL